MDTISIMGKNESQQIREKVRERYSSAATRVTLGETSSCCGGSSCCSTGEDPISSNLYTEGEENAVPAEALMASLGCGNPTALAELKQGETVLDLGSGGGIDVLLSARRVGPTGLAYGLDMTDEMLALAEQNRQNAGVENVRFLKGYIEEIPLPDNSVDVLISNCVINLSADKPRVLKEAYRVLKPGGRFAVSDIVVRGEIPPSLRADMQAWAGCIAGALRDTEYISILDETGFTSAGIEVTRTYNTADLTGGADCCLPDNLSNEEQRQIDGIFVSAFIRATKPQ